MQFMLKCEANVEIGGDRVPLICDVRLGAALDDQPTAAFLGSCNLPVRGIESGQTDTESAGVFDRHRGKLKFF